MEKKRGFLQYYDLNERNRVPIVTVRVCTIYASPFASCLARYSLTDKVFPANAFDPPFEEAFILPAANLCLTRTGSRSVALFACVKEGFIPLLLMLRSLFCASWCDFEI